MSLLKNAFAQGGQAAATTFKLKASPTKSLPAKTPTKVQPPRTTGTTPEDLRLNFNTGAQSQSVNSPGQALDTRTAGEICTSCRKERHYGPCDRPRRIPVKSADFNMGMRGDDPSVGDNPSTSPHYHAATTADSSLARARDGRPADEQAATSFADLFRHLGISNAADEPGRMYGGLHKVAGLPKGLLQAWHEPPEGMRHAFRDQFPFFRAGAQGHGRAIAETLSNAAHPLTPETATFLEQMMRGAQRERNIARNLLTAPRIRLANWQLSNSNAADEPGRMYGGLNKVAATHARLGALFPPLLVKKGFFKRANLGMIQYFARAMPKKTEAAPEGQGLAFVAKHQRRLMGIPQNFHPDAPVVDEMPAPKTPPLRPGPSSKVIVDPSLYERPPVSPRPPVSARPPVSLGKQQGWLGRLLAGTPKHADWRLDGIDGHWPGELRGTVNPYEERLTVKSPPVGWGDEGSQRVERAFDQIDGAVDSTGIEDSDRGSPQGGPAVLG